MLKICVVFGTRPEAIKLAPIVKQLLRESQTFNTVICATSQHREMLGQVLNIFDMKPTYDLDVMEDNQGPFELATRILEGLKCILAKERPDVLLVQGDTTTTFLSCLAAFYFKVPIAHVEAGLRTHNKYSPFPEEVNRRLAGVLADYHFAPTEGAKVNLVREGISEDRIWVTGNTVVDALFYITDKLKTAEEKQYWEKYFASKWNLRIPMNSRLILVTGHRRESFGEGFKNICLALREIAERNRDVLIVYPVHLNPNVQRPVYEILSSSVDLDNVFLIEPLEYKPFVYLMSKSYFILTDSGGIQEEAPSLGKPVLVMRDATERPEAVEAGTARLVGTEKDRIVSEVLSLLGDSGLYTKMSLAHNPYGDGKAAERIVALLREYFE